MHEAPSLPYPGDHRGKDGFLKLAEAFGQVWDIKSDLDLTILPAGEDRVLGLVRFDVVAKATGTPLTLRIAEIYTTPRRQDRRPRRPLLGHRRDGRGDRRGEGAREGEPG